MMGSNTVRYGLPPLHPQTMPSDFPKRRSTTSLGVRRPREELPWDANADMVSSAGTHPHLLMEILKAKRSL